MTNTDNAAKHTCTNRFHHSRELRLDHLARALQHLTLVHQHRATTDQQHLDIVRSGLHPVDDVLQHALHDLAVLLRVVVERLREARRVADDEGVPGDLRAGDGVVGGGGDVPAEDVRAGFDVVADGVGTDSELGGGRVLADDGATAETDAVLCISEGRTDT